VPLCAIVGMHRSGTSLISRGVNLLGYSLGDESDLISPGPDNPRGFWESRRIVSFNDTLLLTLGGSWDAPPDFEPGWEYRDELPDGRALDTLLGEVFSDAAARAWKDPRGSLLLPYWQPRLSHTIVVVRHPREVAASLARRNGIDPAWSDYLWLRYTATALATAADPIVVPYEHVLRRPGDWFESLGEELGVGDVSERIDAFLAQVDPGERHERLTEVEAGDSSEGLAVELHDALVTHLDDVQALCRDIASGGWQSSSDPRIRELGDVHEHLRRTRVALQPMTPLRTGWRRMVTRLENSEREREALRTQVDALVGVQEQIADQAVRLEQAHRELESALASSDAQRLEHERLERELEQAHQGLEAALASSDAQRLERERLERELEQTRRAFAERELDLRSRLGRAEAAAQHQRALKRWLDEASRHVDKLLDSRRWRVGNAIGNTVDAVRSRGGEDHADERLRELFRTYRDWREERGGDVEGHRPAAPVEGRRSPASPRTAVSAQAAFDIYIREVEPQDPPTAPSVALRGIVLASPSQHDEAATLLTVQSLREAGVAPEIRSPDDNPAAVADDGFVIVLHPGDYISTDIRSFLSQAVDDTPEAAAVVFDRDTLTRDGSRVDPRFAPRPRVHLLLEHDDVGRAVAVDASRMTAWSGHAQVLEFLMKGQAVTKVDRIGLHQRPDDRPFTERAADVALVAERALGQLTCTGTPWLERRPWGHRVRFDLARRPRASVIVPFRDRSELTQVAVESVLELTEYRNFEVLLVDNGSEERGTARMLERLSADERVRVLRLDEPFNWSRINNQAAEHATGDVLVFLNNDTRLLSSDWLDRLVERASQPDVGAVGGMLLFPDGRIQHAGVVIGLLGLAGHAYAGLHLHEVPHPDSRVTRPWSAVTGACLAVARDRFERLGGFDESFIVTGSDVDFGLRATKAGLVNVVDPDVQLFHYEKQSRAAITTSHVDVRRSLLEYRPFLVDGDPYWNAERDLDDSAGPPRPGPRVRFARRRDEVMRAVGIQQASPDPEEQAFLKRYDASEQELEENRRVLREFVRNRSTRLDRVAFFVPAFDHVYRGGVYTILRIADHLTRTRGSTNQIVLERAPRVSLEELQHRVVEAWPNADITLSLQEPGTVTADAGICTLWTTAYRLLREPNIRARFYLVQDYEPSFYRAGAAYGLIEQTYRFGFAGIANTPGVAAAYRSYGNTCHAFYPAVDRTMFYPPTHDRSEEPVQLVTYGRPNNPRNAFGLAVSALKLVKERHGDHVRIVSVGADFDEDAFGLGGLVENLGVLPDIRSVADLYRQSDLGLVFMYSRHPSYQPLEYMASGCVTITNHNDANTWLLQDGYNARLTPSTVTAVADVISELIVDREQRIHLQRGGIKTVGGFDWEPELDGIAAFMESGEGRTA
jgi:GT2 family glycosyltransferase